MARILQPYLFGWQEVDADSEISRLRLVLGAMPDKALVRCLEQRRGRGVNRYPIRPCWNALLAGVVFQHESAASLLRELRRNGELRDACGFDPFLGGGAVPSEDAFGRFLKLVCAHNEWIREMFDELVRGLAELLPDLGRRLAIDSKAVQSVGKPIRKKWLASPPDGRRDSDANWGTKTYAGVDEKGVAWKKVSHWFGYKVHLLVDSRYEMPLAFEVTKASASDTKHLLPLVEQLESRLPAVAVRAEECAADRGYDSAENDRELYDSHGIVPVIDSRVGLWQDKELTKPLDPVHPDVFVYDEKGTLSCICPQTGVARELAFCGFEADRKCLKYRCPAAAYGFECSGREACESRAHVGAFGRVARVPLDTDRRIFVPYARHSTKWTKAYKRRTSVERVNSRIDRLLGFEKHFIRGMAKMTFRLTLALTAMLAMALGRIRANQREDLRSWVKPAVAA